MMRRGIILGVALLLLGALGWILLMRDKAITHGDRLQLESETSEALNAAGGPDYPRVIALYRASALDDELRRMKIAMTELQACRDKRPPCTADPEKVAGDATAQLDGLAKTATDPEVRSATARWLKH